MNNVNMFDPVADQDGLLFSEATPAKDETSRKRPLKRDLVLDHLRSGRSLSMTQARQLYGVGHLPSTVSWLARNLGLKIGKTRHVDEFNVGYVSYYLISEGGNPDDAEPVPDDYDPDHDEAETETDDEFVDEPRSPPPTAIHSTPGGATSVSIADIRIRPDGFELLLVGEGESEAKPFYRLTAAQVKLLRVNLELFSEMTKGR